MKPVPGDLVAVSLNRVFFEPVVFSPHILLPFELPSVLTVWIKLVYSYGWKLKISNMLNFRNSNLKNCNVPTKKKKKTRNVSMGHGYPRYCQIHINRALSLTKGHNSDKNWWILSLIEVDLYFMIIYLCMKYESNSPMNLKDIALKPFFVLRSRAITLVIIGGFYP